MACISNDLREWASARALHFGLTESIVSWTISGDVGHRKPDGAIYEAFLSASAAATHVFVDDKLQNVLAAESKGMRGVLFGRQRGLTRRRPSGRRLWTSHRSPTWWKR